MNVVREIQSINEHELQHYITNTSASWHQPYLTGASASYIFIGNIDVRLSEGDIICLFSQYGEVVDCNLIRDQTSGVSKGYCFLAYEDNRSTVLAVDNLNNYKLLNHILRVDHVSSYQRSNVMNNMDKSEFDADVNNKLYDERRRLIWDYELYNNTQPSGIGNHNSSTSTSNNTNNNKPSADAVHDRNAARIAALISKKRERWNTEKQQQVKPTDITK